MIRGTITNPFATASVDETVISRKEALQNQIMPPPVYSGSLGAVVALALAALVVPGIVVIDTGRRTVTVAASDPLISASVIAAYVGVDTIERRVVPADPLSRTANIALTDDADVVVTSGVSVPGGQIALDAQFDKSLGASEVSKSLSGLVDPLETAITASAKEGIIVIDQGAATVRAYIVDDTADFDTPQVAINAGVALSTLAVFHVEPEVSSGAGFFQV